MTKTWREIAIAAGATNDTSSGSWKRRAAVALNRVDGKGSWSRRLAGGVLTAPSWERSARKAVDNE